jgi:hypothetical protein
MIRFWRSDCVAMIYWVNWVLYLANCYVVLELRPRHEFELPHNGTSFYFKVPLTRSSCLDFTLT